jgi:YHS domain-containing protein
VRVFGQDPEIFLQQEGIVPYDVVDPRRHAVLDSKLRSYVNYEVFFFADDSTLALFESDPLRWCGLLTDPVSQRRFRPVLGARPFVFNGRRYFFESDSTLALFEAQPDSFAIRKTM